MCVRRALRIDHGPAAVLAPENLRVRSVRNTPLAQSIALVLGVAAAPFAYAQTAAAPAPNTLERVITAYAPA